MNPSKTHDALIGDDHNPLGDDELRHLRSSLRALQYGSVTIIVQDGCIVQIDRTEKHRLRNGPRVTQVRLDHEPARPSP